MSNAAERASEDGASQTAGQDAGDALLGRVVNHRFKIAGVVASGGMGTIYRGEQLPLGRPVAIKVLNPSYTSTRLDPAFQKRFFLEASLLSRLQHPNIVTVFDFGRIEDDDGERYFMAMELLPGETLHRRLRARGRLTAPEAIDVARQIARGLREAHRHEIVHRDLKPSNIMLVPEEDGTEHVKILDFGLVKVLSDSAEELTAQGSFLGSPRYMSPEQIAHGRVDLRTDVYSLGVILYQMLAGRVPFDSDKSVQILIAHLQTPVPPIRARNPEADVAPALEAFVRRCLDKDRANRPANMEAFAQGLRECARALGLADAPSHHSGPMPVVSLPPRELAPTDPAPPEVSGSRPYARASAPEVSLLASSPPPPPAVAPAAPRRYGALVVGALGAALVALALARLTAARPEPARAPEPPSSFVMLLDSSPPGAGVFEGEARLGATPMRLAIRNDSVRAAPRQLTVRLAGYRPYTVVQGPSDETVRVVAPLATLAPATAPEPARAPVDPDAPGTPPPSRPAARRSVARTSARAAPPSPPPRTPPRGDLDITTER